MSFIDMNDNSRCQGKSLVMISVVRYCLATHKSLLIGTSNPADWIKMNSHNFPEAKMEVVNAGVKITNRK